MPKISNDRLSLYGLRDYCTEETSPTNNPGTDPNENRMGFSINFCQLFAEMKGFEEKQRHRNRRVPINLHREERDTKRRSA